MALQKDLTVDKFGTQISLTNLYISISDVSVKQHRSVVYGENNIPVMNENGTYNYILTWKLECIIFVYPSREAKYLMQEPVIVQPFTCEYDINSNENIISYVYEKVLEIPAYAGAVTV